MKVTKTHWNIASVKSQRGEHAADCQVSLRSILQQPTDPVNSDSVLTCVVAFVVRGISTASKAGHSSE